jgi:hypothetical protein
MRVSAARASLHAARNHTHTHEKHVSTNLLQPTPLLLLLPLLLPLPQVLPSTSTWSINVSHRPYRLSKTHTVATLLAHHCCSSSSKDSLLLHAKQLQQWCVQLVNSAGAVLHHGSITLIVYTVNSCVCALHQHGCDHYCCHYYCCHCCHSKTLQLLVLLLLL